MDNKKFDEIIKILRSVILQNQSNNIYDSKCVTGLNFEKNKIHFTLELLPEQLKESQQIKGSGDAEAAGIYAASYSQDPEFYEFTRSMKAYVETFESKSDVMLIDSDSEFFKYLNDKIEE